MTPFTLAANKNISRTQGKIVRVSTILALAVACVFFSAQLAPAKSFETLYSFPKDLDGFPHAGLLLDPAGDLYGTGAGNACQYPTLAWGNVFKIDSSGQESVVHSFDGTDGACPFDAVIEDTAGNFYGTTYEGGAYGDGNIFKIDSSGNETTLYGFNAGPNGNADGCYPFAGLLRDARGNLYGTASNCGAFGGGTIFKIDSSGNETVLHNFAGGPSDGASPDGGLIMDSKGNLYGTAAIGGGNGRGWGVLYKLTPSGKLRVLHSFGGTPNDGCYPAGTPLRDAAGNFYGTATLCGTADMGIVWKISTDGTETILHNFTGGVSDGVGPSDAGLIADGHGNLYGVTRGGGPANGGTVYKLAADGTFTLLHAFGVTATGTGPQDPEGSLIMDAKGNLYGTTAAGGSPQGNGTVWKLTP